MSLNGSIDTERTYIVTLVFKVSTTHTYKLSFLSFTIFLFTQQKQILGNKNLKHLKKDYNRMMYQLKRKQVSLKLTYILVYVDFFILHNILGIKKKLYILLSS
jgi:hypothetical protein